MCERMRQAVESVDLERKAKEQAELDRVQKIISVRLARAMDRKKIDYTALDKAMGVEEGMAQSILSDPTIMSLSLLARLAVALGCEIDVRLLDIDTGKEGV